MWCEELYLADLIDNVQAVRGYLDELGPAPDPGNASLRDRSDAVGPGHSGKPVLATRSRPSDPRPWAHRVPFAPRITAHMLDRGAFGSRSAPNDPRSANFGWEPRTVRLGLRMGILRRGTDIRLSRNSAEDILFVHRSLRLAVSRG